MGSCVSNATLALPPCSSKSSPKTSSLSLKQAHPLSHPSSSSSSSGFESSTNSHSSSSSSSSSIAGPQKTSNPILQPKQPFKTTEQATTLPAKRERSSSPPPDRRASGRRRASTTDRTIEATIEFSFAGSTEEGWNDEDSKAHAPFQCFGKVGEGEFHEEGSVCSPRRRKGWMDGGHGQPSNLLAWSVSFYLRCEGFRPSQNMQNVQI
ncbi:hypothetical protein HPP92_000099 [Vanilla planifolia]|uniref:Uncharacterized protein n=1 Tax=Vanilla planifolia TaxID=51239 RepID=A0A835SAL9_VANPL|nr:hypothetical protein HPP92_000099 [Vanilla planifolia]